MKSPPSVSLLPVTKVLILPESFPKCFSPKMDQMCPNWPKNKVFNSFSCLNHQFRLIFTPWRGTARRGIVIILSVRPGVANHVSANISTWLSRLVSYCTFWLLSMISNFFWWFESILGPFLTIFGPILAKICWKIKIKHLTWKFLLQLIWGWGIWI